MAPVRVLGAARSPLDDATWRSRHRLVLLVLWPQAAVLLAWALVAGEPAVDTLAYAIPISLAGALAQMGSGRTTRTVAATFALFTVSAFAVHLADGDVAVHFHYFVMLILLAQYEDARPFALGVAYVVLQHGIFGALMPDQVFGMGHEDERPWLWAAIHGGFILAAAGALVLNWRVAAVLRDRERRSRHEAQRYLEVAGALIVALDLRGRVVVANRATCTTFGRGAGELLGQDWFAISLPAGAAKTARAHHAGLIASGSEEPTDLERDNLRADGTMRRIAWRTSLTRDERGRATGTISSGQDVTERRAEQDQLARDHRDLGVLRRLAHEVAAQDDARQAVVDGAAELAGAQSVLLAEWSDDRTALEITAAHGGHEALGLRQVAGEEPSIAVACAVSGTPRFVADAARDPQVNPRLRAAIGAASLSYHPVRFEGAVAGVLVAAWRDPRSALGERAGTLMALAADEAAVALGRLAILRRLQEAALTDPLTGVANRRSWDQALPHELRRARRSAKPLGVALLDLNRFKDLNDRSGHAAGDAVLRACATAWGQQLRATDTLARLGGDEFAVLLPDLEHDDVALVLERLRRATPHGPGAGIGIVVWDGAEDPSELLRRADRALYDDKACAGVARITDPDRVAAVHATGLLAGRSAEELQHITELVAWLLEVPVALVTMVTADRQEFSAMCGLEGWAAEQRGTPLTHSFCRHVVAAGRALVIEDARQDPLLRDNLAIDELGVVAYAGIPLLDDAGMPLGVLCAIDDRPRSWTSDELTTLRQLAARAARHLADDTPRRSPAPGIPVAPDQARSSSAGPDTAPASRS